MEPDEADKLIAAAAPEAPGTWADFGAGDGTFTRALARRLGRGAKIYAVDRDVRALESLKRSMAESGVEVTVVRADLEQPFELPGAPPGSLDGLLVANTLHFVRDPAAVLARLARWLRRDGLAVLIEYDQRSPSRWVPHPVNATDLPALFEAASLERWEEVARVGSAFGGEMYVAVGRKGAVNRARA